MPGWQRFAERQRDAAFEIVGIAIDHGGVAAARPFVEAAGVTFPAAVDDQGRLSAHFGFHVIPNGYLVDERGVLRYANHGGFSVDQPGDVALVERFIAGEDPGPSPAVAAPYQLGSAERALLAAYLRLGRALDELGRRDEAIGALRDALRRDPENLTIRKQIWAMEHPEKFHPEIDWDWQRRQLADERAREIADGACGPDGCPIPRP